MLGIITCCIIFCAKKKILPIDVIHFKCISMLKCKNMNMYIYIGSRK